MSTSSNYNYIETKFFTPFEKTVLNPTGYFVVGAPVRFTYGLLQVIGSIAYGAIFGVLSLFFSDLQPDYERLQGYISNGFSNIGRSLLELFPVIGGIILSIYDYSGNRHEYYAIGVLGYGDDPLFQPFGKATFSRGDSQEAIPLAATPTVRYNNDPEEAARERHADFLNWCIQNGVPYDPSALRRGASDGSNES